MTVIRVNAREPRRAQDPTHTGTVRRAFLGEVSRRFAKFARAIREQVAVLDGFGLKTNKGAFDFPTSAAKIEAFMRWLSALEAAEILTVREGTPLTTAAREAWTSKYIETAYSRGVRDASRRLRGAGAEVAENWIESAFTRPIHADRAGIIYTRAYTELEGITGAMDSQISRVLSEGLINGEGPIEIARQMVERVKKIGLNRARVLARTEVINAHATATLNVYQEAEVQGVEVQSEFTTAHDDRVCRKCKALEGRVYTLSEARGLIPVHPNCRCAWVPVLIGAAGLRLNRRYRALAA